MGEAKYKVGDVVIVPGHGPLTIAVAETCYRFSPIGALWREEELTPYVRPLQVGDRVRLTSAGSLTRKIIAIRNNHAWCEFEADGSLFTYTLDVLVRIPTEANQ